MKLPQDQFTSFENALLECLRSIAVNTEQLAVFAGLDSEDLQPETYIGALDILEHYSVGVREDRTGPSEDEESPQES